MKQIKIMLLSTAVFVAIGSAFATTIQMDPCDDPEIKYLNLTGPETIEEGTGNCHPDLASPACFYVDNGTGPRTACDPGSKWQPQ